VFAGVAIFRHQHKILCDTNTRVTAVARTRATDLRAGKYI
jgi:hypothetical protein